MRQKRRWSADKMLLILEAKHRYSCRCILEKQKIKHSSSHIQPFPATDLLPRDMHHVEEQRRVKNAAPKVYKIVLLCSFKHRNFHFLISLICAGVLLLLLLLLQCSPVCLPCQIIMFTINNYLFRLLPANRRECWLHYWIGEQRGRRRRGDAREMRFEDIDEKKEHFV